MLNISHFFEKFKKLKQNNESTRLVIINTIKDIVGIDIKSGDIELKNDKIYIKTTPIVKSELFMRKDLIEEKLNSSGVKLKLG